VKVGASYPGRSAWCRGQSRGWLFSTSSYGSRPGKNAFQAVKGAKQYVAEGRRIRDGIADQLLQGKRQFSPVRRATIPKPYGGIRELGIPTVTNRLIQQALL